MQWTDLALAIGSNVLSLGILYGVLRTKVEHLESDLRKAEAELKDSINVYVNYRHFDAVIERIQGSQDEMRQDIKEILRYVKLK